MRVLYVLGQSSGGLPHYTAELANAVSEHAEVVVMKPDETTADELFADSVTTVDAFRSLELSMPKIYRGEIDPVDVLEGILSYDAVRRIPEWDPDVVHDPTDLFPQVKLFLKRHRIDATAPVVVTRHEVELNRLSLARPPHLAEELVLSAIPDVDVARTVVHTESQKRALIYRGHLPRDITVIPHGVYSVFGDRDDLEGPPETNTLLFFGNIVPHKGIATLVEAIPKVKREIPDVTLLVAGDGRIPARSRATIRDHAENFEVHDHFVPNERVPEFFGRAEGVVLPYHDRAGSTNGHSGVLATAISFGKPVVASTAGDFPSLVDGSGIGTTVPSRDPDALAAALVDLLGDEPVRRTMAENSRRLAEELSWENVAEKHVAMYESVLKNGRAP